jgi:hypothetical protein
VLQALRWLTANKIVCMVWGTVTVAIGSIVRLATVVFYTVQRWVL